MTPKPGEKSEELSPSRSSLSESYTSIEEEVELDLVEHQANFLDSLCSNSGVRGGDFYLPEIDHIN